MRKRAIGFGILVNALAVSAVLAQVEGIDLTGQYRCVAACAGDGPAFISQSGWQLNVTNDAGVPSRAWVEYPGRIWVERAGQGARYSRDGMTVQFDRGTIWQRLPEPPPPPPPRKKRR